MPLFRLSDTDRERYGCEEWLRFAYGRFTNREARLIERPEPDGPGIAPRDWIEALRGEIVEKDGVPILDDDGKPLRAPTDDTVDVIVWLALRRAGHEVAWPDLEYDRLSLRIGRDPQASQGKEPAATEESQATPS